MNTLLGAIFVLAVVTSVGGWIADRAADLWHNLRARRGAKA